MRHTRGAEDFNPAGICPVKVPYLNALAHNKGLAVSVLAVRDERSSESLLVLLQPGLEGQVEQL